MVYHNEQNEKKLMSKSRENGFGDEKIIWRQSLIGYKRLKYFFEWLKPPGSARYHSCLITHAKLAKSDEAILRK